MCYLLRYLRHFPRQKPNYKIQSVVWIYFQKGWAVCVLCMLWFAGVISTVMSFDRERQREYTLSVTATDQAEEPLIGICQITVLIGDQNDNDPKFENSRYQCKRQQSLWLCYLITNTHCSSFCMKSSCFVWKSLWCWFNHKACLWIHYRTAVYVFKGCLGVFVMLRKTDIYWLYLLIQKKNRLSFITCSSVYREVVINSSVRHWPSLKH